MAVRTTHQNLLRGNLSGRGDLCPDQSGQFRLERHQVRPDDHNQLRRFVVEHEGPDHRGSSWTPVNKLRGGPQIPHVRVEREGQCSVWPPPPAASLQPLDSRKQSPGRQVPQHKTMGTPKKNMRCSLRVEKTPNFLIAEMELGSERRTSCPRQDVWKHLILDSPNSEQKGATRFFLAPWASSSSACECPGS